MVNRTDQKNIEIELSKRSLHDFTRMGWSNVEARPFVDNWHVGAITEHLQAVSAGQIRNIIINVPPRHMKSLTCNVFWPSWDWLLNPWRTFLFVSYRTSLSERDNIRARKLVSSDWYQDRFQLPLNPTPNTAERWGIQAGGERLITSVGGASSTGEGGDNIVVDDPISADGARSEKQRQNVIDWWDETIKSRFNDAKTGCMVVMMQRFHEYDLSGHILANEAGFDHLCLPARYEPKHIYPVKSSIGFKDPRTKEGELLNPKRFGEEELNKIATPGSFADAGQLQQRPAPRSGGMFQRNDFQIVTAIPSGVQQWMRAWDLAASDEITSAFTAGVLMGKLADGRYIIADVERFQKTAGVVQNKLYNTASQDHGDFAGVRGSIPQDPGAGGKAWAQSLITALSGFRYRATPESGDKEARAEPLAAQVENGNVLLLKADWNKAFLDEITLFPAGKFKDQVDAATRAFNELSNAKAFKWYVSGEENE